MKGLIRPFYDRLDIEIPYIWYPIPEDAPGGPVTVFTDRWNDDKEHFWPFGVGVVPNSQKPYWGPLPSPALGPLVGDPSHWEFGFSYAAYLAGKYPVGPRCVTVPFASIVGKVRQSQQIGPPTIVLSLVSQAQSVEGEGALTLSFVSQAQSLPYTVPFDDEVNQAQSVFGDSAGPGADCAHSGLTDLGQEVVEVGRPAGEDWWKIPATAGGDYHLDLVWTAGKGSLFVYYGTCGALTPIGVHGFPGCYDYSSIPAGAVIYVRVLITYLLGTDYSFTLSSGPC